MAENVGAEKAGWFVCGLAVGAAVALLFAPQSGRKTRKLIQAKTEEGRDVLAGSGKDVLQRGRELFERGREFAEEAADMFERGRKLLESTAGKLGG